MEKHSETSCREFCEALASKQPVPGGGGASALVGAIGISLCAMVANYTIGKPKYASFEADLTNVRNQAEELRRKLLELIEADAQAFLALSEAYALPKSDAIRRDRLERAAMKACEAPLEMIDCCCRALDLLSIVFEKGNKMLVSDAGCGAAFCKAAMESAAMNVYVNTKTMLDRAAAARLNETASVRVEKFGRSADRIIRSVCEQLNK